MKQVMYVIITILRACDEAVAGAQVIAEDTVDLSLRNLVLAP